MTLQASGQISIDDIAAEFQSTSKNLLDYYRGGAIVPNHAGTASIPTSGQIGLFHFYGASRVAPGPTVAMPDVSVVAQSATGTAQAIFTLNSDGTYTSSDGKSGYWLTGGAASGVDVYAAYTASAGPSPSGTLNTWLNLGTGRSWVLSRSTNGENTGTLALTFRNSSTLAQLDTASISMDAYRGTPI
jgi:hypothetical protein